MKKITAIMVMLFIIAGLRSVSQESTPGNVKKKLVFCSAEITWMDKSKEKFFLAGFSNDSIIVFPIQWVNKYPKIQTERETRVAATHIKKIAIRIKKIKNSPAIHSNESSFYNSSKDSVVVGFKRVKSREVINNSLTFIDPFAADPLGLAFGIMLLPVLVPSFIWMSNEKVFHINGKQERLDLMKEKLTVKKSKSKKALNTKNQIL